MIALIAAIAKNNVIGSNNDLPWDLPEDLAHFRAKTLGHTIIMGKRTYESILARRGAPLPDRKNIVITSDALYQVAFGVQRYTHITEALAEHENDEKIFLIGGVEIFREGLIIADTMILTHINAEYLGDVYFPIVDWKKWSKVGELPFN
jgi:dihydrofolate reductase